MSGKKADPVFTIGTLVTNWTQYKGMRTNFAAHGFDSSNTEFVEFDNTQGNAWDGYSGFADLLDRAVGRYVILCHQDILLLDDGASDLLAKLTDLDATAPDWAVAGNAGARPNGKLAVRITDPWGEDVGKGGVYPARVVSLDENFLIVRAASGVRPSSALRGFHLYGTDICMQAEHAGMSAWVVDFHLRHLSRGVVDSGYLAAQAALETHWGQLLKSDKQFRAIGTQITLRHSLSGHVKAALWMSKRRCRLTVRRLALVATMRKNWYEPVFSGLRARG